jgi:hypothetical protein
MSAGPAEAMLWFFSRKEHHLNPRRAAFFGSVLKGTNPTRSLFKGTTISTIDNIL